MLSTIALGALALAAGAMAVETNKNFAVAEQLYDSGFMHEKIMAQKHVRKPILTSFLFSCLHLETDAKCWWA